MWAAMMAVYRQQPLVQPVRAAISTGNRLPNFSANPGSSQQPVSCFRLREWEHTL